VGNGFTMTNIDDYRDPQARRLERMKNEFLVAQQRRRERAPVAHDHTDNGPPLAGPATDPTGIAALRP
jgi:SpoVK/Ycf46/Vps4 family AAA+-type ATPase